MVETLHKKRSFPLPISSVNVTKSAGNCGFGHITEEICKGELHFLCSYYMNITRNQDLSGQYFHVYDMSLGIYAHRGCQNPVKHLR